MLKPASEIELDDIPPQTATPLRPASRSGASGPDTTSATGFQTYHAPAALHEQLVAEGSADAAPAVVTPPPRVAAPERRRSTPAPQPVAAATVGAPAAPSRPTVVTDEPEEARSRTGMIVGGAVVAGIVAFVIGMGSGGGASLASATGEGFVLKAPSDWSATGAVPDPALGDGSVALAPSGGGAEATISAARMPSARAFSIARQRGGTAETVTLAEGEGLRYGNALYVVPTGADAVVVSCAAGAAAIAACPEVAGSVEVTQGEVVDAGPSTEGASALRDALTKLRADLKNHSFDLQRAKTTAGQRSRRGTWRAPTRRPLGRRGGTGRRARAAGARRVDSGVEGGRRRLEPVFGRGKAGSAGGARSASARIATARGRVLKAQAALGQAGYPTGSGG